MFKLGPAVGVVNPEAAGTADDPYRIEGWCITPSAPQAIEDASLGVVGSDGIVIEDTTAHVVVRGNTITSDRGAIDDAGKRLVGQAEDIVGFEALLGFPRAEQEAGILLNDAQNVRIEDNTIEDNPPGHPSGTVAYVHGLAIESSQDVEVVGNTIQSNGHNGIGLFDVENVRIGGNLIAENGQYGIDVRHASAVVVEDNDIQANGVNQIRGIGNYGLKVFGGDDPVQATHNYWGAENGPSGGVHDACTGTTASGGGEVITTYNPGGENGQVCFDPWLSSPTTGTE